MSLEEVTKQYLKNLDGIAKVYTLAYMTDAARAAYYAKISAMFDAAQAARAAPFAATAGSGAVVAAAVPIAAAVGVWVALGSGYYEARQIVRKRETMFGFADGYVCGLLRWSYDQTLDKFKRQFLKMDTWDEAMDYIRVDAYMEGLRRGYAAGIAMPKPAAMEITKKLRQLANIPLPKADSWRNNRVLQIDFVINLSVMARKHGFVKAE